MKAKQLREDCASEMAYLSPEKETSPDTMVFIERPKHMLFCLKSNANAQDRPDHTVIQKFKNSIYPARKSAAPKYYKLHLQNGNASLFIKDSLGQKKRNPSVYILSATMTMNIGKP